MRTTLTLDDDVTRELDRVRKTRGGSFKRLINDTLRAGLLALARKGGQKGRAAPTAAVSLGLQQLPSLDNISEVLALSEDERHA